MRAKTFIQILTLFIISLLHVPSNAQHTATAVMNVTVEVVDGSTVQISNFDKITANNTNDIQNSDAVMTITLTRDESILTSFYNPEDLMDRKVNQSTNFTLSESKGMDNVFTFHFPSSDTRSLESSKHNKNWVAEIIYL